jgi:hypothetical protein
MSSVITKMFFVIKKMSSVITKMFFVIRKMSSVITKIGFTKKIVDNGLSFDKMIKMRVMFSGSNKYLVYVYVV